MYKTIISLVVFCGYEIWSLTVRKEFRFMVFENRVLRRKFGPGREEAAGGWRRCIMRIFIIYTPHEIFLV
jgi:hypothetical protein